MCLGETFRCVLATLKVISFLLYLLIERHSLLQDFTIN